MIKSLKSAIFNNLFIKFSLTPQRHKVKLTLIFLLFSNFFIVSIQAQEINDNQLSISFGDTKLKINEQVRKNVKAQSAVLTISDQITGKASGKSRGLVSNQVILNLRRR